MLQQLFQRNKRRVLRVFLFSVNLPLSYFFVDTRNHQSQEGRAYFSIPLHNLEKCYWIGEEVMYFTGCCCRSQNRKELKWKKLVEECLLLSASLTGRRGFKSRAAHPISPNLPSCLFFSCSCTSCCGFPGSGARM